MKTQWLGLSDYDETLKLQRELVANADCESVMLGLEHPTVLTLGLRIKSEAEVMQTACVPDDWKVVFADRGGQATIHSPGQLVVYPIVNLRKLNLGVREFVCHIEKSVIKTLKEYGIEAFRKDGDPGVFTSKGKIGFVGLRVEHGVTSHGLALNVCNDLSLFRQIVSCGKSEQTLDSLQTSGVNALPQEVFNVFSKHFIEALYPPLDAGSAMVESVCQSV